MTPHRPPGLYEELVNRRLEGALEEIQGEGWRDEIESLDPAEAPRVLTIATANALTTDGDYPRAIDIARCDRSLRLV